MIATGYNRQLFGAFLNAPQGERQIDLSNATLAECIKARIQLRAAMFPTYKKQLSALIYNLRLLERDFGVVLRPSQISDTFWLQFVPYLAQRGLKVSTIKHLCQQLKTICLWASKYGAKISETIDNFTMKAKSRKQIALSRTDIARIYYFDVDSLPLRRDARETMRRVKDMFVLSCCLGQRHSDMVRINRSCFHNGVFSIVQQKTGNKAVVDLRKFTVIDYKVLCKLLEKYSYEAPCKGDIKNYNKRLHRLMKYIGLDETVTRENKVLSKVVREDAQRWQLVSSHTARRTFSTINKFDRGFDVYEIMKATGHHTETSFLKYLCEDEED